MANRIDGDLSVAGNLGVTGVLTANISRGSLITETSQPIPIPLTSLRVWDAFATSLGSAGNDDLGITAGTWGTGVPYIVSRDLNALGAVTGYARFLVQLPHEYVAGQLVSLNVAAGMITAVASVSATVDFEVYKHGGSNLVSGSDLVTTSATSINSTTFTEYAFVVTPTTLSPGNVLDVRMAIAANSATGSSHFAAVARIELLATCRG